MPDQASTRYEEHDAPGFIAEMAKLCPGCKVIYLNADADVSQQQQQFNSVIAQGATAIVLDPVDATIAALQLIIAGDQYNTIQNRLKSWQRRRQTLPCNCSTAGPRRRK